MRDGPAGTVLVAVSDPTMDRDVISVTVHGPGRTAIAADDGVTVHPVPGGTRIDVATRHAYGRTFTATLR
jgi:hyaluronate lyase